MEVSSPSINLSQKSKDAPQHQWQVFAAVLPCQQGSLETLQFVFFMFLSWITRHRACSGRSLPVLCNRFLNLLLYLPFNLLGRVT